jgi:NAD(P)-dependent dehydrogenase (short-subunit alcohol dehydrogenase family)
VTGQTRPRRTVLVAGAAGGIGSAVAVACAAAGDRVICVARGESGAAAIAAGLPNPRLDHLAIRLDLADADACNTRLAALVGSAAPRLDLVVNAVGGDERKAFADHSSQDVSRMIEVNFVSAVNLLRASLPGLKAAGDNGGGQFIQVTGFLNARVAFPYSSVDVAMRSATRTLFEAVQRELVLEGETVRLRLFSPAVADTAAERPYLPIWRRMGIAPSTPQDVAEALLRFADSGQRVGVMGAPASRISAALDAWFPQLTDRLWLAGAGRTFRDAFASPTAERAEGRAGARR